jgi:molecular chaperone GrpE (heat shock protein)
MGIEMIKSAKSAVVAALVVMAAASIGGCQYLPQHVDEQPQAKPAAEKSKPAEQSVLQRKQAAERATQKQKEAELAAQKEKEAELAALKQKEAELAALQQECLDSVAQMREISVRWQEAQRAAEASPRIALQGHIANLQKTRQELGDWRGSPCSDRAKADLAQGMDLMINYLMKFKANDRKYLSDERAKAVQGNSDKQTANALVDSAVAQLGRIEGCKGAC